METKSFGGVKRSDIDRIRGELAKIGVTIPAGDDVDVNGPFGVKMRVQYSESDQTLALSIKDKPAFISEGQIWSVVESAARTAGVSG